MKKLYIRAFLALALVFAACQKDVDTRDLLDVKLDDALNSASNGKGRAHFILPKSNRFVKIPQDPKNPLSKEKVELGKFLFHETGLGVNPKNTISLKTYSCASCHFAGAGYQAGVKQGIGEGGLGFGTNGETRFHNPEYALEDIDVQALRSPSAMNGAFQQNNLWNGQFGATGVNSGLNNLWEALDGTESPLRFNSLGFEGLETQAIAGLEVHRMDCTPEMVDGTEYKKLFDAASPNLPVSERYSAQQAGLAIAAYERTIMSNQAPFQEWLQGNFDAMTKNEKRGAILFFEKANCVKCHTGPALNSMEFHSYGMKDLDGFQVVNYDPNSPAHKGRGGFTQKPSDNYKFKVPQLYNLADSPFYGHGASFTSIYDVVVYKNKGLPENSAVPENLLSNEFKALNLTEQEIKDLTLFLESSLHDPNLKRYQPEALPSGNCFPNSDPHSIDDLGCK